MPFPAFGGNRSIVAQVTETNPKRSEAMITAIDVRNRLTIGCRVQSRVEPAVDGPR